MMHRFYAKPKAKNNKILNVFIGDRVLAAETESAEGVALAAGKTGLTSASIAKAAYCREGDSADTAITAVAGTLGTYVSGGFVEIDATNMPGWYQFCPPNAALENGAGFVDICLQFALATDAQDTQIHIDLVRSLAL